MCPTSRQDDDPGDLYDFVVVSNRLPVDRVTEEDGTSTWRRSPGGLVSALAPVMANNDGAWVGWSGGADESLEPFDHDVFHLVPVDLSAREVEQFYEGFSNATLWPLYHDVIAPPEFHRTWWNSYKEVNRRFAEATAATAGPQATVWVQDYQLQLVPRMLRQLRPDLTIGFFDHIPFPPLEIFAQLPWRRSVLEGLTGADLIGFQRPGDAQNFMRCVKRYMGITFKHGQARIGPEVTSTAFTGPDAVVQQAPSPENSEAHDDDHWNLKVAAYPISIDVQAIQDMAAKPETQARAKEIRRELGDPTTVFLGVDRLDYTKGIRHRIKAYGELLHDGELTVGEDVLIQVASPSRERVESYKVLREQVEGMVGRLNGQYDTMEHTAIRYLHHGYPFSEMVALYLATDVMLVTSLRDGMNLVAKEYVAAKSDGSGALVLSEFTGAAEQLKQAILVNPHDIDELKELILMAKNLPADQAKRRMRAMRRQVLGHDVNHWQDKFLHDLAGIRSGDSQSAAPESEMEK
ncbi:alpha,alpha-trehalose-phosphate synthase (UDP-forming) [Kocuria sp.]|uniref:alpha,alpha-trehalose-phosphate synthase (UDP-forming) n=1 Tax=Kocuria sp. TaxID=1871328 RepID=UPI0026DFFA3A|nr:trehalose-6-phosphate synthase [Kocuria sp.]MDO5619548.1 trehalose-6-phosphate synthase [Kocuria sp.]